MTKRDSELELQGWVDDLLKAEVDRARNKITDSNIDQILEELSKRVSAKILHRIISSIKEDSKFNIEDSRKRYQEVYLSKVYPTDKDKF